MIEIKKQTLLNSLNSASQKGQVVVPVETRDCLMATSCGYKKAWPDLLLIQERSCIIIHVGESEANTYLPYKRLDLREIQTTGLLKFKELVEASKLIYMGEPQITYKNIAEVALQEDLVGYLHRKFLEVKG